MKKQEPVTLTPGTAGRLMTLDILPVMIESNEIFHAQFSKDRSFLEALHGGAQRYVRDYRTIRFSMGNRSGHTTAVSLLAKPGDLIISLTDDLVRGIEVAAGVHRIGLQNFLRSSGFPVYNNIWLTEYSLWPRTSMKDLRNKLITSFDQRIIILG